MTLQEFFEKSVTGVIKQGKRSGYLYNDGQVQFFRCFYRSSNGTKCAVGHCISDEEYDPVWDMGDGKDACAVGEDLGWSNEIISLACDLQAAHDEAKGHFVEAFTERVTRIGNYRGLDTSFIRRLSCPEY